VELADHRYQLILAARDALDFDEIAGAKILDPSGVERDQRSQLFVNDSCVGPGAASADNRRGEAGMVTVMLSYNE
jgi:hypothetical protein